MDYCIIYEKGLKPVKAPKFFYFKSNMIKEFNKFKLDHNNFDAGVRGEWRKINPYNLDAGSESAEAVKDLNVDSLDDLFDDDIQDDKTEDNKKTKDELNIKDSKNNDYMSDDDLNELLFDDDENNNGDNDSSDEILDIQKELEAKFDELFGDNDDE